MVDNVITTPSSVSEIENYLKPGMTDGFTLSDIALTGTLNAVGVFDSLTLSDGINFSRGVLITSGLGTPARSNTATGFSQSNGLPGNADLSAFASAAFSGSGITRDATVLTLTFTVTDPSINSLSFKVAFGSEEYPEYSSSSFVDIGAIWTGTGAEAKNYALIDGNVATPLAVINENINLGNFINNQNGQLSIQYDGLVNAQTILVPVTMGVNTIYIGVADTGDTILDSGLFIFDITGSGSDTGGTFQQIAVENGKQYDASENNTIFTGTASDFDQTSFNGFDENDQLLITGSFFESSGAKLTVGSLDLRFDTDGDGLVDTTIKLEDPVPNATVVIASGGEGTSVTLALLAATTDGADSIDGTDGLDFLSGQGGNDVLGGLGGADALSGGAGNDQLLGGSGDDWLDGGTGNDVLTGGEGADVFVFHNATEATGRDRITDFGADDVLVTTARIFDSNEDGVIDFGRNRVLDLVGGGQVTISDSAGKAVRALEFDGSFVDGGVTYYVYSRVNSTTGTDFFAKVSATEVVAL